MDLVALLHERGVGRGPGGRRHLVAEEEQGEGAEDEGLAWRRAGKRGPEAEHLEASQVVRRHLSATSPSPLYQ